ncbi:MAG: hypothetical protein WC157_00480 [Candidatus Paceibacterota bacterium]
MLKGNLLFFICLGLLIGYISLAWTEPSGSQLPNLYSNPINIEGGVQTKSGSLTIGGDFTVSGKSNICQLVAGTCPAGYYSSDGKMDEYGTYRMCCKINN